MSAMSRTKGKRAELEVCTIAKAAGFPAKRTSDGTHQWGRGDIAGVPGTYIEVRRREALNIWACLAEAQAASDGLLPIVAFRRNRTGWYAALPLEDLFALLADRGAGRLQAA